MAGWLQVLRTVAGVRREMQSLSVESAARTGESVADAFGGDASEGPSDAFHGAAPARPGLRLQFGMGGSGSRATETAKKVVDEARNTAKTVDAASKKLEEIFGDISFFDETSREMLAKIAEMSVGFYSGADLLRRVTQVLNGLDKGQGSGAEYILQDRLGDLVELINTYMGREGQTVTEQTFYGFRNRRNRRSRRYGARTSSQSNRSTGALP